MARQVLENGVVLPAEYSDDWYDDMTSNLTKLDDVIGSDSEKLSSSDVGAAALSNNYNDLDNLPTIPTVNDATLTIQKNGVDVQTFSANASSNVTANIIVPTKTSDLTNDSNFVDTSNSAVASGITSAKVTSYDSHIADTDIHVTTADKNKWNNGVSQSYVFRYSSSSVTDNSTIAYSTLDNTDNIKASDKVIDVDGKIFSIVSVDTANQTVTVGSALIDLALDGNVVHMSGNETINGVKTFSDNTVIGSNNVNITVSNRQITANGSYSTPTGNSYSYIQLKAMVNYTDSSPSIDATVGLSVQENAYSDGKNRAFNPSSNNIIDLGLPGKRWANVYATNYYYGSSEVEFSDKFVTTDTAQTISGAKTFNSDIILQGTTTPVIKTISNIVQDTSAYNSSVSWVIRDKDNLNNILESALYKYSAKSIDWQLKLTGIDNGVSNTKGIRFTLDPVNGVANFIPIGNNTTSLGNSSTKWKDVNTYLVNGLTPSSLSMPTDNLSNIIDISSYITVLDGSQPNTYLAPSNGYIGITMSNCSDIQVFITGFWGNQIARPTAGVLRFFMPICKNMTANILVFGGTIDNARFIPCQGNV